MPPAEVRKAIIDYVRANAKPPDKFSHQERLYRLAVEIAGGVPFDDDVLFAAAWMHDLGVFIGHRPEEPSALAAWDNVEYAMRKTPEALASLDFPEEKIPAVVECMRTHQPSGTPSTFEGTLLRDADILEQLGAIAVLRLVSKIGRDTRFITFADAIRALERNLEELPAKIALPSARRLAEPRVQALKSFIASARNEAAGAAL
ncbi:MAG TPA: HD domain-containing protein [Verrucomicrobiae bacterium]|nr:HD domain-containing protein [Verrucomicrobiae bacterium]